MPFSIVCDNRGCGKQMEPYIDPKTNIVYCALCENELKNISHFTKVQMKSLKQFKQKENKSFSTKCQKCNKEGRPVILNDKICCYFCKLEHNHLSAPYKSMLLVQLKTADKDVV